MQEVKDRNDQKRRIKRQTDSAGYSVPGMFLPFFCFVKQIRDGSAGDVRKHGGCQ